LNENPTRAAMRLAVRAEYERTLHDINAKNVATSEAHLKTMAGQNVMRVALETVYEEMMPVSNGMVVQMAMAAASYALSLTMLEEQEIVVARLMEHFAEYHQMRTARGVVIKAAWHKPDGSVVPNHD